MSDFAIETTNLSRKFGSKFAVNKVSLQIKKGEIYGFLGPNGAGKSTTLKMLVGLLLPSSGSAQINGLDLVGKTNDIRLQIGAALQEASLDENQTGREVLELQGRLYGLSKADIAQRMKELSKLIDIGKALDARIKTYSGGMKRRVDLAAALMHNPSILFLDEPTTGLDPISRNKVWEEVAMLNKELGMTIFLTTQYLEEADQLADRIGIISGGKIVEEDTPENLKRRIGNDVIVVQLKSDETKSAIGTLKKIKSVQSVTANDDGALEIRSADASVILPEVVMAMQKDKRTIVDIRIRETSLDDVFLEVTKGGK